VAKTIAMLTLAYLGRPVSFAPHTAHEPARLSASLLRLLLVEDNSRLRPALASGLEATEAVRVIGMCGSGEAALDLCLSDPPDVILMDVQLETELDGIAAAVAIRRELPRLPVVFYSIQDDDAYYRAFRRAGILTHYAYNKQ